MSKTPGEDMKVSKNSGKTSGKDQFKKISERSYCYIRISLEKRLENKNGRHN